ncbi:MAG: response regulator [Desulfobacca sp.]|nr:response regulator [Desulfobacca sp.]
MESKLQNKIILIVDDEPDILSILEEEIKEACSNCRIVKAETYEWARNLMDTTSFDLVLLDIMGVRGFDLLKQAVSLNYKVVMLTAHAFSSENLRRAFELGARSYLPKEQLGNIVPFLEDVLSDDSLSGWRRLFEKLGGLFNKRFGSGWQQEADDILKKLKN